MGWRQGAGVLPAFGGLVLAFIDKAAGGSVPGDAFGVLSAATLWAEACQIVIVAFISYLAWFWLLTRYLAGRLLAFSFLTPLFGVWFGMLLLDDQPSLHFFVAAAMVVGGIVLVKPPARK